MLVANIVVETLPGKARAVAERMEQINVGGTVNVLGGTSLPSHRQRLKADQRLGGVAGQHLISVS